VNKIICFGDSLTNGARDEYYRNYPMELMTIILKEKRKFYYCLNYGVNGETTSHMLDRAYTVISPHHDARFVLLLGGTNDTKIPIPVDIYKNNIEGIIYSFRELKIEIVVGLIPPIYGVGLPCYSQTQGNNYIRKYNHVLADLAQTYNLGICDFSNYSQEFFCDGIHLNHHGCQQMASDWYKVIGEHL